MPSCAVRMTFNVEEAGRIIGEEDETGEPAVSLFPDFVNTGRWYLQFVSMAAYLCFAGSEPLLFTCTVASSKVQELAAETTEERESATA